jgi:hypothetical protein
MLTKAKTAVAGPWFWAPHPHLLAKDAGLRMIDIEKLCRADIDALRAVFTRAMSVLSGEPEYKCSLWT